MNRGRSDIRIECANAPRKIGVMAEGSSRANEGKVLAFESNCVIRDLSKTKIEEIGVLGGIFLTSRDKQGSTKTPFSGLVSLVPDVAFHFYLSLPAAFSQPWNSLIVEPYRSIFLGCKICINMLFPCWTRQFSMSFGQPGTQKFNFGNDGVEREQLGITYVGRQRSFRPHFNKK